MTDVHVVLVSGRERPYVFGHRADAEEFRDVLIEHVASQAVLCDEEVMDSAAARTLIELEAAS